MASNKPTRSSAEEINFSRARDLRNACTLRNSVGQRFPGVTAPTSYLDMYSTTLDQEFGLDIPVLAALLPQLAQTDADGTALLLAATFPPAQSLPPAAADRWFDKMLNSLQDALVSGGNISGNLSASVEAGLRAAWRRQAAAGFKPLLSGELPSIRISPHITITAWKIGKGGELRKGAKLVVHVKGLPTTVLQALEQPFVVKPNGAAAAIRIGARDMQRIEQAVPPPSPVPASSRWRSCATPLMARAVCSPSAQVQPSIFMTVSQHHPARDLPPTSLFVRPRARAATSSASAPGWLLEPP